MMKVILYCLFTFFVCENQKEHIHNLLKATNQKSLKEALAQCVEHDAIQSVMNDIDFKSTSNLDYVFQLAIPNQVIPINISNETKMENALLIIYKNAFNEHRLLDKVLFQMLSFGSGGNSFVYNHLQLDFYQRSYIEKAKNLELDPGSPKYNSILRSQALIADNHYFDQSGEILNETEYYYQWYMVLLQWRLLDCPINPENYKKNPRLFRVDLTIWLYDNMNYIVFDLVSERFTLLKYRNCKIYQNDRYLEFPDKKLGSSPIFVGTVAFVV